MAKRSYTVSGGFPVLDHQPGESFSADLVAEGLNEQVLLETGALVLGKADDGEPAKFACPACVEQGMKRPPKFESLDELHKHYADKHAGLEPPDSVPSDAEEE